MLTTDLVPAAGKKSRRLMIVLHGLGDSLEGYRWLPDALRLPWLNFLLVNAPDPYSIGYSWFEFPGDPAPGIERSYADLALLLDTQREKGFPSEETIVFGFSQGCLMTIETGLRYSHRLAGLIGISGRVSDPVRRLAALPPAARQQRFLVTHGTHDSFFALDFVRGQIAQLRDAGLQVEWREFVKDHTIAGEPELAVIRGFVRRCFAVEE